MCYRVEINASIKEIAKRYNANAENSTGEFHQGEINGFAHKTHPLIINKNPKIITLNHHWGLVPFWSTDDLIKKNTLNARIETLDEKPSFKDVISNRCLVIVTAYYEWRWNDEKGKSKEKFAIYSAEDEIFSLAGIYSTWKNPATDAVLNSFSIVTTKANETMQYIHNNKKRMPVMLKSKDEKDWLSGDIPYQQFAFPAYNPNLLAFPAE
jgi:putative SOS response-associated peptidase YedK